MNMAKQTPETQARFGFVIPDSLPPHYLANIRMSLRMLAQTKYLHDDDPRYRETVAQALDLFKRGVIPILNSIISATAFGEQAHVGFHSGPGNRQGVSDTIAIAQSRNRNRTAPIYHSTGVGWDELVRNRLRFECGKLIDEPEFKTKKAYDLPLLMGHVLKIAVDIAKDSVDEEKIWDTVQLAKEAIADELFSLILDRLLDSQELSDPRSEMRDLRLILLDEQKNHKPPPLRPTPESLLKPGEWLYEFSWYEGKQHRSERVFYNGSPKSKQKLFELKTIAKKHHGSCRYTDGTITYEKTW